MVASLLNQNTAEIHEALVSSAKTVDPAGTGRWKLALGQHGDMPVVVSIEDEWLCFEAPLNGGAPSLERNNSVEAVLECNARLPGGLRCAMRPQTRELSLRADIPLADEDTLAVRIGEICAGLPLAADTLASIGSRSQPLRTPAGADCHSPAHDDDLARLCGEAGWDCAPREEGVSVLLDVPGESRHAHINNGSGIRAYVPFVHCESLAERSRLAIDVLLLTASWLIYLARPTASVDTQSGWLTAGFEVAHDSVPLAGELDRALKALSVACRLCAREALLLQDPDVADAYLAVVGWDQVGLSSPSEGRGEVQN